ncbi:thioesterase family protein [Roseibacterium beibuensis]|uniref:acyl-CoA thioesterase n=1 Tax=[Roseibacterium] beibuensis TaxID=1193142 RepID=UPI00217E085C|nr:thioesterase family protein [Roseibacterium beibuensis]MCS6622686.1 thioesterase family protein [Roseibacterium beibuensis]
MTQTLAEALSLTDDGEGGLTARLDGGFSNAPQSAPQDRGAPFGGLMAALAAGAMRRGLGLETPLQSLTIQYLAAARFDDVRFAPTLNRGGRNVAYASVSAGQGDRLAIQALGTYGRDVDGPVLTPLTASPPPVEGLESTPLDTGFGPWFTRHIEHRFVAGPKLFGQNAGRTPELGCWMRTIDAAPLDEARLLFLLDGLYPTYFTAFPAPPVISASIDLRADLLTAITPDVSPKGWAYFHFTSRDVGGGWAVEDGVAHAPDGRPIALVRQRRKLMPTRGPTS